MPEFLSREEAFAKCKKEGKFIVLEDIDIDKIQATVAIAESDMESARTLRKNSSQDSPQWNSIYKLCYDAVHELVESLLRFDKIKIDNHQCLFAYLCEKYSELELDWAFFEKFRTKRNGINYYGIPVNANDWKEIELRFNLCIKTLQEEIKKKLEKERKH